MLSVITCKSFNKRKVSVSDTITHLPLLVNAMLVDKKVESAYHGTLHSVIHFTRTQLTRGAYYHIGPFLYESGPQSLSSQVRTPSALPWSRALPVNLPYSKQPMHPHSTPPETNSGQYYPVPYNYLNIFGLNCQAFFFT